MTDNKVKDNEIIKVLEECIELRFDDTDYATVRLDTLTNALDLINRLQAQNKDLSEIVHKLTIEKDILFDKAEELKAEVKRLKECPKCVYEYDGEIMEYCVQGPCSNFKTVEQLKDEVVKEFAERVKEFMHNKFRALDEYEFEYITERDIDNLLKETEGKV